MAKRTRKTNPLIDAARELCDAVERLRFGEPITRVYNPLRYAWPMHEAYLRRFGSGTKRVVLLGMNPGPWGMAQTGVPFGEVDHVRDWLGLDESVGKPDHEHPKRPVEGLACSRSEVSGRRLWSLFAERFGSPEAFFAEHFVSNYCPLVFMQESGKNFTPDKLPAAERGPLEAACDAHLLRVIEATQAEVVVGVGAFAAKCAARVLGRTARVDGKRSRSSLRSDTGVEVVQVLHPSPASPAANRGWAEQATRQLIDAGVWPPEVIPGHHA